MASSGQTYTVVNPATGKALREVSEDGPDDVDRAVRTAHDAFRVGQWRTMTAPKRGQLLTALGEKLLESRDTLALSESLCSGKPLKDCLEEVAYAAQLFFYYGAAASHLTGETIPVDASGMVVTIREPVGVCALIVPWNAPLLAATQKVAPALAAGNTIVLKPAPATPLTALELPRLAAEAGVEPGVVNVLTGSGPGLGRSLVAHPLVRHVSFTGSTTSGIDVMTNAAAGLKRVTLELGGKSPNIVFGDSDLGKVIESSLWAVFWNAGQDCAARSRAIVERSVYAAFVEQFAARASALRVGDPLNMETEIGCLISPSQRDRVLGFIERAQGSGARVVTGGKVIVGPGLEAGTAVAPTVIVDIDPGAEAATTEIFGPVLCVLPFDTVEEAIALGNQTEYGLAASLWTRDIGLAQRVARELESGQVSINSNTSVYMQAPFGGRKMSGIGRQLGMEGLRTYSELKTIYMSGE